MTTQAVAAKKDSGKRTYQKAKVDPADTSSQKPCAQTAQRMVTVDLRVAVIDQVYINLMMTDGNIQYIYLSNEIELNNVGIDRSAICNGARVLTYYNKESVNYQIAAVFLIHFFFYLIIVAT